MNMTNTKNIIECCLIGNLHELKKYIKEGISVDFQNSEGESPLQVSASNGYLDLVSFLLENEAIVDLPNNYGWTPLMLASKYGHFDIVDLLLKMKAKVNICNKLGINAVVAAAWNGNVEILHLLFKMGAMIDYMPQLSHESNCEFSAVMAAAFQGHNGALNFFLERSVNANKASHITGLTPLMLAAYNGHLEAVQSLVSQNSNTNVVNICRQTALDLANICGKTNVKNYLETVTAAKLKNENTKKIDIFQAIKNGDEDTVNALLKEDPSNSNITDTLGISPLIIASKMGYRSIVVSLLYSGADINFVEKENGWSALMYGVFYRHIGVVQALLDKGAQVDKKASNGYTALDFAKNMDTVEGKVIQRMLVQLGSGFSPRVISETSDAVGQALSAPERFRELSSEFGLKSWVSGLSQNLHNRGLSFFSSKKSENTSTIDVETSDDSANDVFLESSSPLEGTSFGDTLDDSNLSIFYYPNMHLAQELKEHNVESVTPPFPSFSKGYPAWIKKVLSEHFPPDSKPLRKRALRVPKLLNSAQAKELLGRIYANTSSTVVNKDLLKVTNMTPESLQELNSVSTASAINPKHNVPQGDLTVLLNEESLQKYVEKFRKQEVDIDAFQYLNENDLSEIGISNSESQRKLLELIQKVQMK